jgi:hypothetical protein
MSNGRKSVPLRIAAGSRFASRFAGPSIGLAMVCDMASIHEDLK